MSADTKKTVSQKPRIKVNKEGEPLCAKCGVNPRYKLTKRSTSVEYYYTYCKECENERQKVKSRKTKARSTAINDLELNNAVVATLTKNGFETVRDLETRFAELDNMKGLGAKSRKQIAELLQNFGLLK